MKRLTFIERPAARLVQCLFIALIFNVDHRQVDPVDMGFYYQRDKSDY